MFKLKSLVPAVTDSVPVVVMVPANPPDSNPLPPVEMVMLASPALIALRATFPPAVPGVKLPLAGNPLRKTTVPLICGCEELSETAPDSPADPLVLTAPMLIPFPMTVNLPEIPRFELVVVVTLPKETDPVATARTAPPEALALLALVLMLTLLRLILPGVAEVPVMVKVPVTGTVVLTTGGDDVNV